MKIKDLMSIKVPALKPRDTAGQAVLAAKRNAGGPMRDKAKEAARGKVKHKGRAYEDMVEGVMLGAAQSKRKLGSKVEFDDYKTWKKSLPAKSTFNSQSPEGKGIERAQALGKDFEGVAGAWDHETDTGWIYEYYLKKENLAEGRRHVYGKGDEVLVNHPNKTMQKIGNGEEVKVMTKSGVAKIVKVQFYNGGSMYKLDRKVKLADGDMAEWISDREVSFDLDKGAAPDAKAFARRHATGN
jgi:hypothetical protein